MQTIQEEPRHYHIHAYDEQLHQNINDRFYDRQLLEQNQVLVRPKGVEISPRGMNSSVLSLSPSKRKQLPQLKIKNHGRLKSMRL